MANKFYFIGTILILGFVFMPHLVEAAVCQSHNVFGWAWSENIGWLSFSCENCDTDENGFIDVVCGGDNLTTLTENYGVDINSTNGEFSGYAWSEHIGWLSFEAADVNVAACPDAPAPCQAEVDMATGEVSGWAKILTSNSWLRLRDTLYGVYGVYIDKATGEFHDWAWLDLDYYGWLSFNCENCEGAICDSYPTCGDPVHPDYKVRTTLSFPPAKPTGLSTNLDTTPECPECPKCAYCQFYSDDCGSGYCGMVIPTFTWDSDPGQTGYEIEIWDPIFTRHVDYPGPTNPPHSFTLSPVFGYSLQFGQTYSWKVRTKNNGTNWSPWSDASSFTTDNHAWPCPEFAPLPLKPAVGEVVQFIQDVKPSEALCYQGGEHLCQVDPAVTYNWDFGNGKTPDICNIDPLCRGNATTTYDAIQTYTTRLEITDTTLPLGHQTCKKEYQFGIGLPYPVWKEIRPR